MKFQIDKKYWPRGDQEKAIQGLVAGLRRGDRYQTLLGVTGSGKTFTMAAVATACQRPALIISHNKTLAAQLVAELRDILPQNAVEYFVSYYDYYQPEAYLPNSDTYIEKEATVNDEIDRLRHAATQALLTRRDVIVVASVSAIYGLGSPKQYEAVVLKLSVGETYRREAMLRKLIEMQFKRTNADLERGSFRARGNIVEVLSADSTSLPLRITFEGDRVSDIEVLNNVTRKVLSHEREVTIFPAKHYIAPPSVIAEANKEIEQELSQQLKLFEKDGKLLEAERLERRVNYDLEMVRELGYCNGIENYSRYFDGRQKGEPPYTLLDYFPKDYLLFIDESHVAVPQLRAMYEGDRSRKETLVNYGFRLPSAFDNRPLKFDEFTKKINQAVFASATPSDYERQKSSQIVEQLIRPTGLVDPEVTIRPTDGQVDDLSREIAATVRRGERGLVTTLTKKMAEDLTEFLRNAKFKVRYLHSEVDTLERLRIIRELRQGKIDVVVGVNLLREGLDLPEVSLVAILDADKEGFLRSETSLVQTIGRAARNINGRVVLYADNVTGSMERALHETKRRRAIQLAYNKEHGITPTTIQKNITSILEDVMQKPAADAVEKVLQEEDLPALLALRKRQMKEAAEELRFEEAALLRDEIRELSRLKRTAP